MTRKPKAEDPSIRPAKMFNNDDPAALYEEIRKNTQGRGGIRKGAGRKPGSGHPSEIAREIIEARTLAKALYLRADELIIKLASKVKPGEPITLPDGRVTDLINNYRGKTIVWGHGGVRKWDLSDPRPSV